MVRIIFVLLLLINYYAASFFSSSLSRRKLRSDYFFNSEMIYFFFTMVNQLQFFRSLHEKSEQAMSVDSDQKHFLNLKVPANHPSISVVVPVCLMPDIYFISCTFPPIWLVTGRGTCGFTIGQCQTRSPPHDFSFWMYFV